MRDDDVCVHEARTAPRRYAWHVRTLPHIFAATTEAGRSRWLRAVRELARACREQPAPAALPLEPVRESVDSVVALTLRHGLDELDLAELGLTEWPRLADGRSLSTAVPHITILDVSLNPLRTVRREPKLASHTKAAERSARVATP